MDLLHYGDCEYERYTTWWGLGGHSLESPGPGGGKLESCVTEAFGIYSDQPICSLKCNQWEMGLQAAADASRFLNYVDCFLDIKC